MWLKCSIAHKGEKRINWSGQHNHESDTALHVHRSAGGQKIFKNLGATSKSWSPEEFHEDTPILRIHKYWRHLIKFSCHCGTRN